MGHVLLLILMGYVFGCIHGSQLVRFLKKIDLRNEGVKNAGASNAAIVLGWKYGLLVGAIDVLKGTFAVIIAYGVLKNIPLSDNIYYLFIYLTVFFVILGHNYPINMKFKGGKGTASLLGSLFAIDWKIAMISIAMFFLFSFLSDYLVLGVMFLYFSFLVTTYLFGMGLEATVIVFTLTLLSAVKHLENYKRILNKTEIRLSNVLKNRSFGTQKEQV